MDDISFLQMREFILATEFLMPPNEVAHDINNSNDIIMESSELSVTMMKELKDVVFKLRAFTESVDDNMALGIEMGMQRAADMIENVIKRYEDGNG